MKIYSTLILSLFLCPKPLLLANSPANCSPLTSSYSSSIEKASLFRKVIKNESTESLHLRSNIKNLKIDFFLTKPSP